MKGLPSYADISLLIMHVIKSDEINDKINELISSELDLSLIHISEPTRRS